MKQEIFSTVGAAAAKAAPPVTVAGAVAAGINLDRLVVVLTIIYLAAQISYLGWRWVREWRQKVRP
ncbi:hypothetical protein [Stenotrophomonas sp. 24(2023)]|uniref:hypothetical protein n=1 Tax=Stenotrophomonas sp. 24(2023) TaxID=3068324 RepID=UPI0027E089E1|nr:hypothetical protein [Stenotrophomonas sp. 24(2023)]WMJ70231.1 hypothetical protein Q9R17_03750 [Stenotrophomonas sp. 24(2023)]